MIAVPARDFIGDEMKTLTTTAAEIRKNAAGTTG
jgi:hypothetical protein